MSRDACPTSNRWLFSGNAHDGPLSILRTEFCWSSPGKPGIPECGNCSTALAGTFAPGAWPNRCRQPVSSNGAYERRELNHDRKAAHRRHRRGGFGGLSVPVFRTSRTTARLPSIGGARTKRNVHFGANLANAGDTRCSRSRHLNHVVTWHAAAD